jgi:predicted membrane metal-binding protein
VLLPWRSGGPVAIIGLQIVLATLAAWLVARLAGRVSSWPRAPLACGLIYAFCRKILPSRINSSPRRLSPRCAWHGSMRC